MIKAKTTLKELSLRHQCLQADIYQRAATISLHSLESLCRRLHIIELKIYSSRGGIHGKEE